ncbi:MAG: hypothetical protein J6D02_05605 [Lachnospira sp.]|nr:hypothetical protein [Lachnospira sp.]
MDSHMIVLKIIGIAVIVLAVFFVVTFIIYFFNLDMKLAAGLQPVLTKLYDRGEQKRQQKSHETKENKGKAKG